MSAFAHFSCAVVGSGLCGFVALREELGAVPTEHTEDTEAQSAGGVS